MKILNVCSNFDPITGGGEAERTYQMSLFLLAAGDVSRILTIDTGLSVERKRSMGDGGVIAVPCISRRFYIPKISPGYLRQLVMEADIVHLIGHWTLLNMMVYLVAKSVNKPYVICPAGALSIFGRSKFIKKLYDLVLGQRIIKNANRCIAVTAEERNYFISRGVLENKIEVIPNGISEVEFVSADVQGFRDRFGLSSRPFLLFVGRLNVIKGPDLLLDGFSRICERFPDLDLVFVGPDGGMLPELKEFARQHGVGHKVHFLGYLGGAEKSNALHAAKLLVIPSRHEAMSIVALEAGMCGTPVMLTDQCGFDELAAGGCGWVVPASAEGIQEGLTHVLGSADLLGHSARSIKNFVLEKFSWHVVIERYRSVYASLLATRVLIISQYFWPESFRINELVKTLVEKGVEVDILTGKPNYPEGVLFQGYKLWGCPVESYFGATVFRVPLVPRGRRSALGLALNYISFVFFGLLIAPWILRKRRYDSIFVYGLSPIIQAIPALFIGWLNRRPVVLWIQDLWPESLSATGYVKNKFLLGITGRLVRYIYRHADLLLVQSRGFVPLVQKMAPGKQIVYYPNSVDNAFSEQVTGIVPNIPELDEGFPIVFAGNIGVGQAVDVIVDAARLLRSHPEIRFVVIGQGSRWDWMSDQVELHGLTNLHLPGRFPVTSMPGLMQKAGALLVTLTDEPIFAATVPNKVQAYMASGRPILAAINGEGARLVAESNAGLCTPAGDAKALAAAALELYRMTPEGRIQLGINGREYFRANFDHDNLTDQLVAHLRSAANDFGSEK